MPDRDRPRRSPFTLFFVYLWRGITWLRVTVLNILFLFLFIVLIAALVPAANQQLPNAAPLLLAPSGMLVDQYSYTSPQQQLLQGGSERNAETLVYDLVRMIDSASGDARITGIVLKLDYLHGGGISKMEEIGAALNRFRNTGKPVIAVADYYTQQQYFLASYADEIHLHNLGGVELTGFAMYRNYYKEALDKLAVKFHVFKVGEFKDFVEPYIRDDMSEASRNHNQQWLDELWSVYSDKVETQRRLPPGTLTQFINDFADQLASTEGNTAQLALDMKLVDHIGSRQMRNQALIARFGHDQEDAEKPLLVDADVYRQQLLSPPFQPGDIALIVARGTILDGQQPEGSIGSDTLTEIIRRARQDTNTKAIVLRVDSGGGSAFASEIIRSELQTARDQGLPVVVSMGSVAASGGYWIAMAADEVWATPTTITGSIGVFGVFPTVEKTLSKLGIHSDGMGTTNLAGALRIDRPLSPEAANVLQQGVEHVYDRFIGLVAESRETSIEEIHQVAQGRVWTGRKAQELGLVDQLGGLDQAIASAAQLAGLEQFETRLFERELSPQEQLIRQLLGQAKIGPAIHSAISDWTGIDVSALKGIGHILSQQSRIEALNAPRSTYALCVSCMAL